MSLEDKYGIYKPHFHYNRSNNIVGSKGVTKKSGITLNVASARNHCCNRFQTIPNY